MALDVKFGITDYLILIIVNLVHTSCVFTVKPPFKVSSGSRGFEHQTEKNL